MADLFPLSCPNCGKRFSVSVEKTARYRGKTIKCPACQAPLTIAADFGIIPTPTLAAPAPAPAVMPPPIPPNAPRLTGGLTAPAAPQTARRKKTLSPWAITGIVAGGIILLSIPLIIYALPFFNRARETANRVKCASQMRQIGFAISNYARTNGGAYPANLSDIVSNSSIPASLLVCPSSNDTPAPGATPQEQASHLNDGTHLSYTYIGGGLTTAAAGPQTVVLFESDSDHSGDGMNVLFGDGHVEFLKLAPAHSLIQNSAASPAPQANTPQHVAAPPRPSTPPQQTPSPPQQSSTPPTPDQIPPSNPAPAAPAAPNHDVAADQPAQPPAPDQRPMPRREGPPGTSVPLAMAATTPAPANSPVYGDVIDLMGSTRLDPAAKATFTSIAGKQAGRRPWYQRGNDDQDVVGFQFKVEPWDGKPIVRSFTPLFDHTLDGQNDICNAKPGYVVAGLLADADEKLHAVRIIFAKETNGHLDTTDEYLSDWFGTPVTNTPPKLLAGHGEHVIGICGKRGMNLDGVGLVIEP